MGIPVGGSKKDRQTKLKNRMKGDLAYHVLSDKEKKEGYDVFEEKYGKKAAKKYMDAATTHKSATKGEEAVKDYVAHVQKHEGLEFKKGGRVTKRKKTRSSGAATHGFGKEIR